MADIALIYRVAPSGDAAADRVVCKAGLTALTDEVLALIAATDFCNADGAAIDTSVYVSEWDEWDEYEGILSCSDSIGISGGCSEYDSWETDGRQRDCGLAYAEELAEADWLPFRDLILAMSHDLGKGIAINFDALSVSTNYHTGGVWFNYYQESAEIRTNAEIERDRLVAEQRQAQQRAEALKVQAEKAARRANREPLMRQYEAIANRFGYAFRFVHAEHAVMQGIRINPTTADATRFLDGLNGRKTGGKFKYCFSSINALETALTQFAASQSETSVHTRMYL